MSNISSCGSDELFIPWEPSPQLPLPLHSMLALEEISCEQEREYDPITDGTVITVPSSDKIEFSLLGPVREYNVENYVIRGPHKNHVELKCTCIPPYGMFMQCTFAAVTAIAKSDAIGEDLSETSTYTIVRSDSRFVIDIKRERTKITAKPSRNIRQTVLPHEQKVVMIVDVFVPSTIHGGFNQIARVVSNTFNVVCKLNI